MSLESFFAAVGILATVLFGCAIIGIVAMIVSIVREDRAMARTTEERRAVVEAERIVRCHAKQRQMDI